MQGGRLRRVRRLRHTFFLTRCYLCIIIIIISWIYLCYSISSGSSSSCSDRTSQQEKVASLQFPPRLFPVIGVSVSASVAAAAAFTAHRHTPVHAYFAFSTSSAKHHHSKIQIPVYCQHRENPRKVLRMNHNHHNENNHNNHMKSVQSRLFSSSTGRFCDGDDDDDASSIVLQPTTPHTLRTQIQLPVMWLWRRRIRSWLLAMAMTLALVFSSASISISSLSSWNNAAWAATSTSNVATIMRLQKSQHTQKQQSRPWQHSHVHAWLSKMKLSSRAVQHQQQHQMRHNSKAHDDTTTTTSSTATAGLNQLKRNLLAQGIDPYHDAEGQRQVHFYLTGTDDDYYTTASQNGLLSKTSHHIKTKNTKTKTKTTTALSSSTSSPTASTTATTTNRLFLYHQRQLLRCIVQDLTLRGIDPLAYLEAHPHIVPQHIQSPSQSRHSVALIASQYQTQLHRYGQIASARIYGLDLLRHVWHNHYYNSHNDYRKRPVLPPSIFVQPSPQHSSHDYYWIPSSTVLGVGAGAVAASIMLMLLFSSSSSTSNTSTTTTTQGTERDQDEATRLSPPPPPPESQDQDFQRLYTLLTGDVSSYKTRSSSNHRSSPITTIPAATSSSSSSSLLQKWMPHRRYLPFLSQLLMEKNKSHHNRSRTNTPIPTPPLQPLAQSSSPAAVQQYPQPSSSSSAAATFASTFASPPQTTLNSFTAGAAASAAHPTIDSTRPRYGVVEENRVGSEDNSFASTVKRMSQQQQFQQQQQQQPPQPQPQPPHSKMDLYEYLSSLDSSAASTSHSGSAGNAAAAASLARLFAKLLAQGAGLHPYFAHVESLSVPSNIASMMNHNNEGDAWLSWSSSTESLARFVREARIRLAIPTPVTTTTTTGSRTTMTMIEEDHAVEILHHVQECMLIDLMELEALQQQAPLNDDDETTAQRFFTPTPTPSDNVMAFQARALQIREALRMACTTGSGSGDGDAAATTAAIATPHSQTTREEESNEYSLKR